MENTINKTLEFENFKQYEIKGVIYDVISYFDETAEEVIPKLKRLLKDEIRSKVESGFFN